MKILYQYTDRHGTKHPAVELQPLSKPPAAPPQATWNELHTHQPSTDLATNHAWMLDFANRLPTGRCQCRGHWMDYLKSHPPDWSQAGWFAWTVAAHNAVNVRLGKAVLSLSH